MKLGLLTFAQATLSVSKFCILRCLSKFFAIEEKTAQDLEKILPGVPKASLNIAHGLIDNTESNICFVNPLYPRAC